MQINIANIGNKEWLDFKSDITGEFAVFHSSLMHRSLPFESGDLRVSLAVRLARNGTVVPEMFPTDRGQGDGSYGFAKLNPSAVIQFN